MGGLGTPPSVVSALWTPDTPGFWWWTDPRIRRQVSGERGGPARGEEATRGLRPRRAARMEQTRRLPRERQHTAPCWGSALLSPGRAAIAGRKGLQHRLGWVCRLSREGAGEGGEVLRKRHDPLTSAVSGQRQGDRA